MVVFQGFLVVFLGFMVCLFLLSGLLLFFYKCGAGIFVVLCFIFLCVFVCFFLWYFIFIFDCFVFVFCFLFVWLCLVSFFICCLSFVCLVSRFFFNGFVSFGFLLVVWFGFSFLGVYFCFDVV